MANSEDAGLGVDDAVDVGAFPNKPPAVAGVAVVADDDVVAGAAGLLPKSPPAAVDVATGVGVAAKLLVAPPPKSPPLFAVEASVVVGVPCPKRPPPLLGVVETWPPPNSPAADEVAVGFCTKAVLLLDAVLPATAPKDAVAGLEESAGGAPAGVVEAKANKGFAGVDAAGVGVLLAPSVLFPNKELPVFANKP